MPTLSVVDTSGTKISDLELSESVFGAPVNKATIRIALNQYLANQRHGSASTKTKGEKRGGGAKPWRQKGTGRARAGSTRSPIWRGGGVTFGPRPRDFSYKINKKTKRSALRAALSALMGDNKLLVMEKIEFDSIKTKHAVGFLNNLGVEGKTLVLLDQPNDNVALSFRNLPSVKVSRTDNINIFDLLHYDTLIATSAAIKKVEEMLQ